MTNPPDPHSTTNEVWRELAHLRQENAFLKAILREYGTVCLLAGKELISHGGVPSVDPQSMSPRPGA